MRLLLLVAAVAAAASANPGEHALTQDVKDMYSAFPFPPVASPFQARHGGARVRDDFAFIGPSHTPEIRHHVFGGRLEWGPQHRVLLAGGGTGVATLALVRELRAAGAAVVHADLTLASLQAAQELYAAAGVEGVALVETSLLDPALPRLGSFDYIDCSGVVHHTASPERALAALAGLLRPRGGIGFMVYGALGRTAIYHVQQAVRPLLDAGLPLDQQLDVLYDFVNRLPPSNWMHHQPSDGLGLPRSPELDAVFVDAFLHRQDVAYTVDGLRALVEGAGLRRAGWLTPAFYEPERFLPPGGPAAAAAAGLDDHGRALMAEALGGFVGMHELYLVRADNPVRPPVVAADVALVPRISADMRRRIAAMLRQPQPPVLKVDVNGNIFEMPVGDRPDLASYLLQLADGHTSLAAAAQVIQQEHVAAGRQPPAGADILATAAAMADAMNAMGWMQLRWVGG